MAKKTTPTFSKTELTALANYQQALSQVTSFNANAASAELQTQAYQRQIDALKRTAGTDNALFSIQEAQNILQRDKKISDLSANLKYSIQDIRFNYRPEQLGQVKVAEQQVYRAINETQRQAGFVNREAALQDQALFYQRQSQQIQREEQAIQYDISAQKSTIEAKANRQRSSQTLMAANIDLLASQSTQTEGGWM